MKSLLLLFTFVFSPFVSGHDESAPWEEWYGTIKEVMKYEAWDDTRQAKLNVELEFLDDGELELVENEQGEFVGYKLNGKLLDMHVGGNGRTKINKFSLTWEGKNIPVPERFWNDIIGLGIWKSSLESDTIDEKHIIAFEEFQERLKRPRLEISAEGGTLLIEWRRGEECDSYSTIRWIVSKSGTVLRHRHIPPHSC